MERTIRLPVRVVAVVAALVLMFSMTQAQAQALFTTDLTLGSRGAQVSALQTFLINRGYAIPAISSGIATPGYFGAQTQAAVAAYQRANGIQPPAGYFGPITRAHVNAVNPNGPNPTTPPSNNDDSDDDLSGGEASLERYRLRDGNDDDVEEGRSGEVAEIEFRVEDADVRLNRLDLSFTADNANAEDEPWDAFDTIRLLVDGDVIAEEDVSDEDDWLDDDEPYTFRFTGIDEIFREGDMANITIEVEAQNGVVDANTSDTWTVFVDDEGIRAEDAEGLQQYVGDDGETVTFDISEEGAGDDLTVRTSSDDPDSTTLQVEDDMRSDWYTIFAFDLEADEADIDLDSIGIDLMTGSADVDDVVDDLRLVIDGDEFDDYDFSGSGTNQTATFDIDGDATVDEGDRVTVELEARFKSANGSNFSSGETIRASVDGSDVEGEGADDLTADGSATGETHILGSSGVNVSRESRTARSVSVDGADNDYAVFEIEVEISAFEDDAFISENAATAFRVVFEDASTGAVLGTATATTTSITSDADTQNGYYRIDEGDTETFTFAGTLNPSSSDESRSYRMRLVEVYFNDTPNAPDQTWTALPASEYRTPATFIND